MLLVSDIPVLGLDEDGLSGNAGENSSITCDVTNALQPIMETDLYFSGHCGTSVADRQFSIRANGTSARISHFVTLQREDNKKVCLCIYDVNNFPKLSKSAPFEVNFSATIEKPSLSSNVFIEEGYNMSLSCLVWASPAPRVMWRWNNTMLDTQRLTRASEDRYLSTLWVIGMTLSSAGIYSCVATNGIGVPSSVIYNVAVNETRTVVSKFSASCSSSEAILNWSFEKRGTTPNLHVSYWPLHEPSMVKISRVNENSIGNTVRMTIGNLSPQSVYTFHLIEISRTRRTFALANTSCTTDEKPKTVISNFTVSCSKSQAFLQWLIKKIDTATDLHISYWPFAEPSRVKTSKTNRSESSNLVTMSLGDLDLHTVYTFHLVETDANGDALKLANASCTTNENWEKSTGPPVSPVKEETTWYFIIVAVICAAVLISLIIFIICLMRLRKQKKLNDKWSQEMAKQLKTRMGGDETGAITKQEVDADYMNEGQEEIMLEPLKGEHDVTITMDVIPDYDGTLMDTVDNEADISMATSEDGLIDSGTNNNTLDGVENRGFSQRAINELAMRV